MGGFLPDWQDIEDPKEPKLYEYLKTAIPKSSPGSGLLGGLDNLQLPQPTTQTAVPKLTTVPSNLRSPQSMMGAPRFNPATISRVIPGRTATVPTSSVVQTQVPLEQEIETIKKSKELLQEQMKAKTDLLDNQADWQIKQAEVKDRITEYEKAYAEKQASLEREKAVALKDEVMKLQTLTTEAQNTEIQDYWADKSTGTKILAAIGVALSSMGNSMLHNNSNPAAITEFAIEQDLQKQKMNLQKKYSDVEAQQGVLSRMSQMYDDQEDAMNASRIASLRGVSAELAAMEQRAASDQTRMNIAVMRNELDQKANAIEQQFFQSMRSKVTQQFATKRTPTQVVTQGQEAGWVDYNDKVKKKETGKFVPAYGGFARSEKEARDLRDAASKREQLKGMLRQLISFRENNDQFTPENRARGNAIWRNAQLLAKGPSFAQLGVIAGPDLDILNSVMEDPNAIFKFSVPSYKATLETVQAAEQADIRNQIEPAYNIPSVYRRNMTAERKLMESMRPGL